MFTHNENIERLKKLHKQIKYQSTGTPEKFAENLNIGKRHLYNILDELKTIGAPIQYSRKRETFYYSDDFELEVSFSIKIINDDNIRIIYGGNNINNLFISSNYHITNISIFEEIINEIIS